MNFILNMRFHALLIIIIISQFVLLLMVTLSSFSQLTAYLSEQQKKSISDLVKNGLRHNELWAKNLLTNIANNRYIQDSFHDLELLDDYSYPLINRFGRQGLSLINYYTEDGSIYLKAGYLDDKRESPRKLPHTAAQENRIVFSVGEENGFVYNFVASPFYVKGKKMGVIELGINMGPLLMELKEVLGLEAGVLLNHEVIDATHGIVRHAVGQSSFSLNDKQYNVYSTALDEQGNISLITVKDETVLKQMLVESQLLKVFIGAVGSIPVVIILFVIMRNRMLSESNVALEASLRQLQETQEQLLQKNCELNQANQTIQQSKTELESFVYTVSHDLKAPAISLHGMASLLNETHREKLGQEGQHYLDRLLSNASFIEQLIIDLLELSKIGRKQLQPEWLKTEELVKDVFNQCYENIQKIKVTIEIHGTLPGLVFDSICLKQIFLNLVVNGIKFMGDQPHPKIEIGGREDNGFVEFYVKDNGIGIDPQYHGQIFGIFHRIKELDVEGTGIGLAIVKKIVDSAGGRIWLQSKKGQGTTFFFRLAQGPSL